MKIALIGPGIMPIPPPGWGAVEILIWDYYRELQKQGHQVDIVNKLRRNDYEQRNPFSPYCQELIQHLNNNHYDFVHIHYDVLHGIMPYLTCKKVAITSHYPYIDQLDKHQPHGYQPIFQAICNNSHHLILALSQKDYHTFQQHCTHPNNLGLIINAANSTEITPLEDNQALAQDKSIYVAKIEPRKQQHKYHTIPDIHFYGPCDDASFRQLDCYKGEVSHPTLMERIAHYGNLVLLSNGENGTPLVIKEALMAGLPIVTNSYSSNDLDTSLPFIDIIPDDKLDDLEYIHQVIQENRKKQHYKADIRKYALTHFSYEALVHKYIEQVNNYCPLD